MTCAEIELTSAFLDGELAPADRDAAERHLATCPDCQAFAAAATSFGAALRAPGVRRAAPPELRGRILADLELAAQPAPSAPPMVVPFRPRRAGFVWGALSGAGVSGLAAAILLAVVLPPSPSGLASGLADAHSRALTHGDLVQVASSDHHKVKPWLARHAPLSPPVSDFAAQGFPLLGARVDKVRGQDMAVLAYGRGAHVIDLYVWPLRGAAPPPSAERRGFHERFWTRGDLAFAAVSDVQPDALETFVGLVQHAGE
jgi:anti-sigma factor RsiW